MVDELENPTINISSENLIPALQKLKPFAAKNGEKKEIIGIYLLFKNTNKLILVATNRRILCEIKIEAEVKAAGWSGVLLPMFVVDGLTTVLAGKAVPLLIEFSKEAERLCIKCKHPHFIYTAFFDGAANFPDYEKIIPEGKQRVHHNFRADYLKAIFEAFDYLPVNIDYDAKTKSGVDAHIFTSGKHKNMNIKCVAMSAYGVKHDQD